MNNNILTNLISCICFYILLTDVKNIPWRWSAKDRNMYEFWRMVFVKIHIILTYSGYLVNTKHHPTMLQKNPYSENTVNNSA